MIMLLTCSNFPDKLSDNDELREFELSGSDSTPTGTQSHDNADKSSASTSTDNIRRSSYGRQIKKNSF